MAAKLAIYGGKGTVPDGLIQPWPEVTQSDRDAIAEVIASEKITEQQRIQSEGLANEWAEYMDVEYCIPVNSGTAALHLCVAGVGIEPRRRSHYSRLYFLGNGSRCSPSQRYSRLC